MGDGDEGAAGESPPEGERKTSGARGRDRPSAQSRDRGERSGRVTTDEITRAMLDLPDEKFAQIMRAKQARSAAANRDEKLSDHLIDLDAEQAHEMIKALDETLEEFDRKGPGSFKDLKILEPVGRADADLVPAIIANSGRRKTDYRHSVQAARNWLVARHGEDAEPDRKSA